MQSARAWNPCQRMPSETYITVFVLTMIGMRVTNGTMSMQTKHDAVQRTWRITARKSPCLRTASNVSGRSVLSLDASSPLTRANLRAGTAAPSRKGQIQRQLAQAKQSTHWRSLTATSRCTKCTLACLAERRTGIWANQTTTLSPPKSGLTCCH